MHATSKDRQPHRQPVVRCSTKYRKIAYTRSKAEALSFSLAIKITVIISYCNPSLIFPPLPYRVGFCNSLVLSSTFFLSTTCPQPLSYLWKTLNGTHILLETHYQQNV